MILLNSIFEDLYLDFTKFSSFSCSKKTSIKKVTKKTSTKKEDLQKALVYLQRRIDSL